MKRKFAKQKTSKGIKTENFNKTHFHSKPKIHIQGNSGKLAIGPMNLNILKCYEYFDNHLEPIVKKITSYVQHTTKFLGNLQQIEYLVSVDVKFLYFNIQNTEGVKSIKASRESCSKQTTSTNAIGTILALILTLSNFLFNCQ